MARKEVPKRRAKSAPKTDSGKEGLDPRVPERSGQRPRAWAVATLLALSIAVVYGPSVDVPFIFDDSDAIQKNLSIKSLTPLFGTAEHPGPLNPPRDTPVSGRPAANLTLAVNYA